MDTPHFKAIVKELLTLGIRDGFGVVPIHEDGTSFVEGPALLYSEPVLESWEEVPNARAVRAWLWNHRDRRCIARPGSFLWIHRDPEGSYNLGVGTLLEDRHVDVVQRLYPDQYTEI